MKKILFMMLLVAASFSTFAHVKTGKLKHTSNPTHVVTIQKAQEMDFPWFGWLPVFVLPCGINIVAIQNLSGTGPILLSFTDYMILFAAFDQALCAD